MKVGVFTQSRPEFLSRIPADLPHVVVCAEPDGTYSADTLAQLQDCEAFLIAAEPVTEQLLAGCPHVKIVQRAGVGYNTLDLAAGRRRGVYMCNVAGVNKEPVAEYHMAHICALNSHLREVQAQTRALAWPEARMTKQARELKGKLLGIVGLGNTGGALAKRARAFEMELAYNDIREVDPAIVEATGARFMEKDDLFAEADFVSICTDLNDQSRGMVDARRLALMKPTAYLVCCARGGIVDEAALRDALNEDRLAGAGIDVFSHEPLLPENPLLQAKNIIMTAHLAGVTPESSARGTERALANMRAVVERGERPQWIVNGL